MDVTVELLKPILPTIILLIGGKWLLIRYELEKTLREQQIELSRAIREQQYIAVSRLYEAFSELMELYRLVNGSNTYPDDENEHLNLLQRASSIDAKVDALILQISCEFITTENSALEDFLGHMRQSVQLWRECIKRKQRLPFDDSHQEDYTKFKETFSAIASYMVHRIHTGLEPPKMRLSEARNLVMNVFSNKYETEEYQSIQNRDDWVDQLFGTRANKKIQPTQKARG